MLKKKKIFGGDLSHALKGPKYKHQLFHDVHYNHNKEEEKRKEKRKKNPKTVTIRRGVGGRVKMGSHHTFNGYFF